MVIIRQRRVPFAVKGGGHTTNPKFSSTRGILIAMRRFSKITYYSENQTVDLGAGLVWGDVYRTLESYNVTVNGGRVGGPGVSGLTLGGGYGWKSNQYGLTMESVIEYEVRVKLLLGNIYLIRRYDTQIC
jgi:FAD/FMN-containing dehydrogenase